MRKSRFSEEQIIAILKESEAGVESGELIDPELNKLSDEQLIKVLGALYELGEIIFDDWATE